MTYQFPSAFLWGAATSAHQTEGGNVNNDWWEREHSGPDGFPFPEPSGDACDSYHRYETDFDIAAELGLNAYRFSLEWSRIEPEEGEFSRASLDHYRRMVDACRARDLTPMVTLYHFTMPRWFHRAGGWHAGNAADRFERFCERVLPVLREAVPWVCTINEPNLMAVLSPVLEGKRTLKGFPGEPDHAIGEALIAAHGRARGVLSTLPGVRAGYSVACFNFHPDGDNFPEWTPLAQDWYLESAAGDDFLGVQAYSRVRLGPEGPLDPEASAELTSIGTEYYPACVAESVSRAWTLSQQTPLLVTENGIPTDDDGQRTRYIEEALAGMAASMSQGVEVAGYFYWSLLDNFEWAGGYRPKFGLVAVNRESFARTIKPSARRFGAIARQGRL